MINNISEHRNWKWFLRLVKDVNNSLYERLTTGIYTISVDEKTVLQSMFNVDSGLYEILDSLTVVK
jgi:hypothetical protein